MMPTVRHLLQKATDTSWDFDHEAPTFYSEQQWQDLQVFYTEPHHEYMHPSESAYVYKDLNKDQNSLHEAGEKHQILYHTSRRSFTVKTLLFLSVRCPWVSELRKPSGLSMLDRAGQRAAGKKPAPKDCEPTVCYAVAKVSSCLESVRLPFVKHPKGKVFCV